MQAAVLAWTSNPTAPLTGKNTNSFGPKSKNAVASSIFTVIILVLSIFLRYTYVIEVLSAAVSIFVAAECEILCLAKLTAGFVTTRESETFKFKESLDTPLLESVN